MIAGTVAPYLGVHDLSDAKTVEWGALVILGTAIIVFGLAPSLMLDFIDVATTEYLSIVNPSSVTALP